MRRRTVTYLLASLVLAACSSQSGLAPATGLSDARAAFTVDLPDGFVVVKRPIAVEDFEVFEVQRRGVPYIGIYAGNAPDTQRADFAGARLLETRYQWPGYLHVWVYDLPPDQKRSAEKIAASVRVTHP